MAHTITKVSQLCLFILTGIFVGCGSSNDDVAATGNTSAGNTSAGATSQGDPRPSASQASNDATSINNEAARQQAPSSSASPGEVVELFFQALRRGDDNQLAKLLTTKAREETAKSGLGVRSLEAGSLTYKVGGTEIQQEHNGAYVKSLWTEHGDNGAPFTSEVTWVLRQQADGWRIAGMATNIEDIQQVIFFDFEKPEDMLRKQEYIRNQVAIEQPVEPSAVIPVSHQEAPNARSAVRQAAVRQAAVPLPANPGPRGGGIR